MREMLGGGLADAHARALTYPPRVIEMVDDLVGNAPRVDVDLDYDAYRATVPPRMRREDSAVIHSLLRLRESFGPFDLELALLRGVDPVSHFFWKFYDPGASFYAKRGRPTLEEVRQHGSTVEDHYRYVDSLLGELRASGTRDHVVVLLSDHGFEAGRQKFRRGGTLSGTHASPAALDGIFVAAGGPFRRGVELERASILDVAPTLLHLLGVPVSQEIEGRVLLDALEPSYRAAHPVRTVPRYDPAPPPAAVEEDTRAEDALREELRALGYIE
jgi:predicted AlkP superfamily phosphohydrolase/phosphomutase